MCQMTILYVRTPLEYATEPTVFNNHVVFWHNVKSIDKLSRYRL